MGRVGRFFKGGVGRKRGLPSGRQSGQMKTPGPLHGLLQLGAAFYLVTHGVSLPADAHGELHELGWAMYYSSLAWLVSAAAPLRQAAVGVLAFMLMLAPITAEPTSVALPNVGNHE
jgi:hypothetical protein